MKWPPMWLWECIKSYLWKISLTWKTCMLLFTVCGLHTDCRIWLTMKLILVIAICASLASCEWTCETCTAVVSTISRHMTSSESVGSQIVILLSDVCPVTDDAEDCVEKMPQFWTKVAELMWPKVYDPEEEWMCATTGICGDPDARFIFSLWTTFYHIFLGCYLVSSA